MEQTTRVHLRYLRIAPRKTRFLARTLKGLAVEDAEAALMLTPRRAGIPLLKLLRAGVAAAKQVHKAERPSLYVREIRVDQGPKLKRWFPRARGAVDPVERKMSHVTLILGVREAKPERFTFAEKKPKKEKRKKEKPKEALEKKKEETGKSSREEGSRKSGARAPRRGFMEKMFRRKAV